MAHPTYIKSKTIENSEEEFDTIIKIVCVGENRLVAAKQIEIPLLNQIKEYDAIKFFIHNDVDDNGIITGYVISEYTTGMRIYSGSQPTVKKAIAVARGILLKNYLSFATKIKGIKAINGN